MKYVVPLFHSVWGRIGVGPQNWDAFQYGFGIALSNGKFAGVTWNQWWRPRRIPERRKIERRQTLERRAESGQVQVRSRGPQEIFQVLRRPERRSNVRARTERRISTNGSGFIPLSDLVHRVRKGGALADETCALLADFFCELCSGREFGDWKRKFSPLIMFEESGWSESDHREKFRDYAVACCLEVLRPGTLGWRTQNPNNSHLELVARFAELFPLAPLGSQRKAIRDFFEAQADLSHTVKGLQPKKLRYSLKALFLVWMNRDLKPKPFFEKMRGQLRRHGIELSPKPGSYRKQIERLKQAALEFEDRFRKLQA